MTRVALLPLDDRPVCYDMPQSVAALARTGIIVPRRELLGRFMTPGDTAGLACWLSEVAPALDVLVVAVDAIAYGGLIASRAPTPTVDVAEQRVATLRELKRSNPNLRILASSVILRNTTTATPALMPFRGHLSRYVTLREIAKRDPSVRAELEQVRSRVPGWVLEDYDAARVRDHAINRLCVELVGDGTLDLLVLLQEDTTFDGPQRPEQEVLRNLIETLGVGDRVHLYPGADEGGATLVARALTGDASLPVRVIATSEAGLEVVAPFEDRPLKDTLAGHFNSLKLKSVWEADATLVFHTPCATRSDIDNTLALTRNLLASGKRVYLADVAVPNGSDPRLMGPLVTCGLYAKLSAYAGWNTAGNTLGTLLAALRVSELTPGGSPDQARERFLTERLLDDWVYQRALRSRLERLLRGPDCTPTILLGDGRLELAQQDLEGFGLRLANRLAALAGVPSAAHLRLPWPRAFEVEVLHS